MSMNTVAEKELVKTENTGAGDTGSAEVVASQTTDLAGADPNGADPDGAASDITSSRRWKKNRRRGRLHKRQLETSADEGTQGGKQAKVDIADSPGEDSKSISEAILAETDYYFENGLRKVYPYVYTYLCYCKQRWKGKTILEMLNDEFFTLHPESHSHQIEQGAIKVNGKQVKSHHVLHAKNELISNRMHRHELPVVNSRLTIVEENDDCVVIDKPSSIPVHPCGRYRHNSVIYILAKEYNLNNLRVVYRLDRLTSGLLILAKNHRSTNKMMDDIKNRKAIKVYLCKVEGMFPDGKVECEQPLDKVHHKVGTWCVKTGGKPSHTTFERISYCEAGDTSIVKCWPHTGRTHQIRVHLQYLGYPITNDPLYNSTVWGPEKGKGARYHKTAEQLYQDLIERHASHVYETGNEPIEQAAADNISVKPQDTVDTQEHTSISTTDSEIPDNTNIETPNETSNSDSTHSLRLTPDPNCDWCKKVYKDPKPSQLVMYLHALSYEGADWKYSTEPPEWAR